jgi:formylglycine-generating enzyme required for sulfatase activity
MIDALGRSRFSPFKGRSQALYRYPWKEEAKKFSRNSLNTWQSDWFDQTDCRRVVNVSWNDAVAFAQLLSRNIEKACRLPSEAEREYACRAGTTSR